jgi:serine/threonine protein kinase
MGAVFLGRSAGGHLVAVKVIHAQFLADDEYRRRFAREVAAARRVNSVFTAQVVDADSDDVRAPWLATRYIEGPSLAEKVRGAGPLPVREAVEVTAGIAEALVAIHAVGVVHRDLKPANVLLAHDGPHVIDFGIAQAVGASALTNRGVMLGTPAYMSPEQAQSQPMTGATDVFSLGGILFFTVAGRGPFAADHPAMALYNVLHKEPDLSAIAHEGLRRLVVACLDKDAVRRPSPEQIMAECRVLLDQFDARTASLLGPTLIDHTRAEARTKAAEHLAQGNALGGQRRHGEAEAAYREVLRLDPTCGDAHLGLGYALAVQGRHVEAETAFREALRLDPPAWTPTSGSGTP